MVTLDVRRGQLGRLIETLGDVLTVLRRDPQCQCTSQVEQILGAAQLMANGSFTQVELNDFSRSVCDTLRTHLVRYCPPTGLTEEENLNFDTYVRVALDRALELRVVGRH